MRRRGCGGTAEGGVALVAHFLDLSGAFWVRGEGWRGGLGGEGEEGAVEGGEVEEEGGEVGVRGGGGGEGFGGGVEG